MEEEGEEVLNVLLGIDPGWVNLGYVLTIFNTKTKILMAYSGVFDTKIHHKSNDTVAYVIGISNFFLRRILPRIEKQNLPWRAIALAIEQQPKKKQQFTKHALLQQMIETVAYTYFAKRDSFFGKHFNIYRYNAISTKKVFGVYRKGATYEERKSEILDKVNSLVEFQISQPEEIEKYPLIMAVKTHHEADALACLNVYINKSHNQEEFNVGLYRKTKSLKRKLERKQQRRGKDEQQTKANNTNQKSRAINSTGKQTRKKRCEGVESNRKPEPQINQTV